MFLVSVLCWSVAGSLVRRSLRGDSKCECRTADFSALVHNGSLPVTHAMLYPSSGVVATYAFPSSYGSSCAAWDEQVHPACADRRHPPSWCLAQWCYVDKDCAEADVRQTVNFGQQELYYSYSTCGSVDTATPEVCLARDRASCSLTSSCAWQAAAELCQSSLCQCLGEEVDAPNFSADYGQSCGAWDHDRCRAFAGNEEGLPADESLGLWCCMPFCFVDQKCPSSVQHPAIKDKYISYVSCPADAAELAECPAGYEPKDAHGNPLLVSSSVAAALDQKLMEEREAKLKPKPEPKALHKAYPVAHEHNHVERDPTEGKH